MKKNERRAAAKQNIVDGIIWIRLRAFKSDIDRNKIRGNSSVGSSSFCWMVRFLKNSDF
jgi:hypothetical protein